MNKIKILLLFIGIIVLHGKVSAQQNNLPFKFSETNYGYYRSVTVETEQMPGSPSGDHKVVTNQVLIKQTARIPAKIGSDFGINYKLSGNKKDTVQLEIEWVFPQEMVNPAQNIKYKSIRYPIDLPCDAANGSTYSLDNDFEVIKGDWLLNVYYNNQIIYIKKFKLY